MWTIKSNALCLCLLAVVVVSLRGQESIDDRLGSGLLDLAYEKYRQGDIEAAQQIAGRILDFSPDSSDALYLSILPLLLMQSKTREIQYRLETALDFDTWYYFSPEMAHLILAQIFFRTQKWTQLADLLRQHEGYFADLWHFRIQALLWEGKRDEAERVRLEAVAWHPRDVRFIYPWILDSQLIDPVVIADILSYPDNNAEYRDLLTRIIPRVDNASVQLQLLQRYFLLEGTSPFMALLASSYPELAEFSQNLVEWGGLKNKYLVDYARDHRRDYPTGYELLSKELSQFSGVVGYDVNLDGYDEQSFIVQKGRVAEWRVDENQDGVFEFRLTFNPLPSAVHMSGSSAERTLFYGPYPQLSVIRLEKEEETEYFYFQIPGPLFPLLQSPVTTHMPSILSEFSYEMPDLLSMDDIVAHAVVRMRQEGRRSLFFRNALPWLEVVDNNGDGILDELRFLDRGVNILLLSDADYDGWFEVVEWSSGEKREALAVDINRDYLAEFFFDPELNQQLWNFDPSSRQDIHRDVQKMISALRYAEELLAIVGNSQ